jgi:hypothetical protein
VMWFGQQLNARMIHASERGATQHMCGTPRQCRAAAHELLIRASYKRALRGIAFAIAN